MQFILLLLASPIKNLIINKLLLYSMKKKHQIIITGHINRLNLFYMYKYYILNKYEPLYCNTIKIDTHAIA